MRNAPRIDLYVTSQVRGHSVDGSDLRVLREEWLWRWRMWSGSRKVSASTQGYTEQRGAIENMEFTLNGEFRRISTPDHPQPFGQLVRSTLYDVWTYIPVRLLP